MDQYIYLIIMFAIAGSLFFLFKEVEKALLAFAIIINPWQGGLWIQYINDDLRLCTIFYFIVLAIVIFKGKRFFSSSVISFLLICFMILSIVASFNAIDKFEANRGAYIFFNHLLLFYCVLNVIRKPEDIKYILFAIAISLIFQGTLSLIKYKFMFFKVGVIDQVQSYMRWRAKGTFYHANAYGMFLIFYLPVAIRVLLISIKIKNRRATILWSIATVLGFASLLLSQNRGSWIGFMAGLLVTVYHDFITGRSRMKSTFSHFIFPAFVILIFISMEFGGLFVNRMFKSDASKQLDSREEQWKESFEVILEHPLGIGFRNYNKLKYHFVHNLYLIQTAEIGMLSVPFFLVLLIFTHYHIRKLINKENPVISNLALGMNQGFWGFLIASIVGPDFFYDPGVSAQFYIYVAVLIRIYQLYLQSMKKWKMFLNTNPQEDVKINAAKHLQQSWFKMLEV